jgi:uncharacterized protein YkwD
MLWALITSFALVASSGAAPAASTPTNSSDRVSASESQPSPLIDSEAEQQLLELANQARKQAGVPPLTSDAGLTAAARAHADVMAQQRQLSHQFPGEPSLTHRLASSSNLLLDHAGENVAVDVSAVNAAEHLMLSPPHRENLLNASYNITGFGVVRVGNQLYVVEDFAHSVPKRSANQTEKVIADTVLRTRRQASLPELSVFQQPSLREATCSMAQQDRLGTRSMRELSQRYTVISYTNSHPEVLPANAGRLIADRRVHNVSVAACYARTGTYPNGVYWVSLLFY